MPNLLVVETSPRGAASISRQMTERFVASWKAAHPVGQVTVRDLAETSLPFVTAPWLHAYFTPVEEHSAEMAAALRLSDELVAELMAATDIVIATPVYNYNVPAALKAWVDHIVRKGMTLDFDGSGLVTGKKATVLIASGGVYTDGSPIQDRDIATQYLKLILKVIGITDVTFISAGGAKVVDMQQETMDAFMERHMPEIVRAATA